MYFQNASYHWAVQLNPHKLKQTLFLILLFALGGFLFWMLRSFISAFLGAVVFYVLLRKPYFYLTEKSRRRWNRHIAAFSLMLLSFIVMVLPVLLVTLMLSNKIGFLIQHYRDALMILEQWSEYIEGYLGVNLLTEDTIRQVTTFVADILPRFLSATAGLVTDIFVLYFILYFMLTSARKLEDTVRRNMPFDDENDALLLTELKNMTVSNSIGIGILAVLQAITAYIGYLVFGVNEPFFWAVITGIMSVLPVVGTAIVWLPIGIVMFIAGNTWQAAALLIYGALVITNIDNVFRFVVQKKLGDVHPLITFFGVVLGLNVFGFVGIIFGPLLISYFIILLKIYRNEYIYKK
ncbi:MAG: AI-2E family transporter [Chitinophagales bacterium]|nr:AI-2E family transporter [Chitinophagales bacterium]MDW8418125.1 AI-2E family transporter [Chitinophagales bacterium]